VAECESEYHHGRRQAEFSFRDHWFCCECMSALCSWFLDGGTIEEPDMFANVLNDQERDEQAAMIAKLRKDPGAGGPAGPGTAHTTNTEAKRVDND
jgi:hypothetical protein